MGNAWHATLHGDHEHLHGLRRAVHPLLCADHLTGAIRAGCLHAQPAELSHTDWHLAIWWLERGDHHGGAAHRRNARFLCHRAGSSARR